MPTAGDNLGLTIADTAGASSWDTWMNADLGKLDAVVHLDVINRTTATPPGSPAAGDRYLVAASPTGAWAGHTGDIAVYRAAAWVFYTPKTGWLLTSQADAGVIYKYESGAFVASSLSTSGAFTLPSDISPAQITSNQNDYNPTGLSTATILRLNTDASRNVTGLQGGSDGRIIVILNVGSTNLVLKSEDSGSSAANRFALESDLTLAGKAGCLLAYDSTSSRWRCIAASRGSSSVAVLDDLTDVVITSVANGQIVEYNGTNWVNVYPKAAFSVAITDYTTPITTGTAKMTFRMPYGMSVTKIKGALKTAQSSGSIFTVDVNVTGTGSVFSTTLTVDNAEKTSETAATAAVLTSNPLSIADDAEVTVDVDQVGAGDAVFLTLHFIGRRTT